MNSTSQSPNDKEIVMSQMIQDRNKPWYLRPLIPCSTSKITARLDDVRRLVSGTIVDSEDRAIHEDSSPRRTEVALIPERSN